MFLNYFQYTVRKTILKNSSCWLLPKKMKLCKGCSPLDGIFRTERIILLLCRVFEIQTTSRLIKVQQQVGKKSWVAFYFYGEILISSNQNLFSCKQISSLKPRVHRESTENGGSKQCRFIQWASISAWCGVNKCSFKCDTSTVTTRMLCFIFPNKWYCLYSTFGCKFQHYSFIS